MPHLHCCVSIWISHSHASLSCNPQTATVKDCIIVWLWNKSHYSQSCKVWIYIQITDVYKSVISDLIVQNKALYLMGIGKNSWLQKSALSCDFKTQPKDWSKTSKILTFSNNIDIGYCNPNWKTNEELIYPYLWVSYQPLTWVHWSQLSQFKDFSRRELLSNRMC